MAASLHSPRVAHVVESWPPVTSGYATRSRSLIEAQARRHQAAPGVVVSSRQYIHGETEVEASEPLRGRIYLSGESRRERVGRQLRRFYVDGARLEEHVRTACKRMKADLIHAHWSSGIGHAALRAARSLGIPFVAEVRFDLAGAMMTETFQFACAPLERLARRWFERHLGSANGIAAASYSLAEFIRSDVPQNACDVITVPNGIEEEEAPATPRLARAALRGRLGLEDDVVVVGSTTKMLRYEGLDVLLSALEHLKREPADVRVLLVGDGPRREPLQQRVQAQGLPVTFTGRVPRSEIPAYLRSMDLFVVPRRAASITRYASPIKVSEAMAAGLPVVGSRLGDLPWMLAGERGALVAPGSARVLARALAELAADADRRRAIGARARRWAREQPSWAESAGRYDELYDSAFQHYEAHGN